MKIRATVIVNGLVQGVNFRYYTKQTAQRLNVKGWVKNLSNGDVRGCFEGEESDVRALIDWCRKGPSAARVDSLDVEQEEYREEFEDFQVRH